MHKGPQNVKGREGEADRITVAGKQRNKEAGEASSEQTTVAKDAGEASSEQTTVAKDAGETSSEQTTADKVVPRYGHYLFSKAFETILGLQAETCHRFLIIPRHPL